MQSQWEEQAFCLYPAGQEMELTGLISKGAPLVENFKDMKDLFKNLRNDRPAKGKCIMCINHKILLRLDINII